MANSLPKKIIKMKEAGKIAAMILDELIEYSKIGMTTYDIDLKAKELMQEYKVKSASKGYGKGIIKVPFPGYVCVGKNSVVTHGIGSKEIFLEEGDLVSIDVAIKKGDYFGDNAASFIVGKGTKKTKKILEVTKNALKKAVKTAKIGSTVGDIGHAIQTYVEEEGYNVVKELVGHTIGKKMHEEPMIPGFGKPNTGQILEKYHTIAMDTMITEGDPDIEFSKTDHWTVTTVDGKLSCLMEDTFYVDKNGGVVLTNSG